MTDWRAHDEAKDAWVRARLKGVQIGPLERHQDRWRWLVYHDTCGWPADDAAAAAGEPRGADNAATPRPVR